MDSSIVEEKKQEMIKNIKWSIDYHTKKLEEEKLKLKVLQNNNHE